MPPTRSLTDARRLGFSFLFSFWFPDFLAAREQTQQQLAHEFEQVRSIQSALNLFKTDNHQERGLGPVSSSVYEEPSHDPDVWGPPHGRDPDVWPSPTPAEHRSRVHRVLVLAFPRRARLLLAIVDFHWVLYRLLWGCVEILFRYQICWPRLSFYLRFISAYRVLLGFDLIHVTFLILVHTENEKKNNYL